MEDKYYPVAQLKERYQIGKQADINRRKYLNIPAKKIDGTYVITQTDLKLLDALNEHLKSSTNAKMEDFKPQIVEQSSSDEDETLTTSYEEISASIEHLSPQDKPSPDFPQPVQFTIPGLFDGLNDFSDKIVPKVAQEIGSVVKDVVTEVINTVNPTDTIAQLKQLQSIVEQGWWITTQQIKELTGTTPKLKKGETQWQRGSFLFTKVGKIGNQSGWKVSRIPD